MKRMGVQAQMIIILMILHIFIDVLHVSEPFMI